MAMDQILVAVCRDSHTENGYKISIQIVMQNTKDKTKLDCFFHISPCSQYQCAVLVFFNFCILVIEGHWTGVLPELALRVPLNMNRKNGRPL
jgi:hypothetical protein